MEGVMMMEGQDLHVLQTTSTIVECQRMGGLPLTM